MPVVIRRIVTSYVFLPAVLTALGVIVAADIAVHLPPRTFIVVHEAKIDPSNPAPGEAAIITMAIDNPPSNLIIEAHADKGRISPDRGGLVGAWQYTAPGYPGQDHVYIRVIDGSNRIVRDLGVQVEAAGVLRLRESSEFGPSPGAALFQREWHENARSNPIWRWVSGAPHTPSDFEWRQTGTGRGDHPGQDLSGYTRITFRARGGAGGEFVRFRAGGPRRNGARYPESFEASLEVELTREFRQFSIDLAGKDLRNTVCAFGWTLVRAPGIPVAIYVDNPEYRK